MSDRIHRAWLLRQRIHAWFLDHPRSSLPEVFAAMPDINPDTLRAALDRMRRDGDMAMVSGARGRAGLYAAVTAAIRPESETRTRLKNPAKPANLYNAIAKARADLKALERARREDERRARHAQRNDARILERIKAREEKAREQAMIEQSGTIQIAPGHIRHRSMARAGDASSGGQGAVRARVTINCSHNY